MRTFTKRRPHSCSGVKTEKENSAEGRETKGKNEKEEEKKKRARLVEYYVNKVDLRNRRCAHKTLAFRSRVDAKFKRYGMAWRGAAVHERMTCRRSAVSGKK